MRFVVLVFVFLVSLHCQICIVVNVYWDLVEA